MIMIHKERFQESVFNAHNAFINKYPKILKIDVHDMADCDLTESQTHDIIDNIDQHDRHIALSKTFDDRPEITRGGWGNLGKLLVCNAIASFGCGGPPGLILCGWGCWCMFCQQSAVGGWIC